jgi:hypothetical protein
MIDLSQFDSEYQVPDPAEQKDRSYLSGPECLPDGANYDLEIQSATMTVTKDGTNLFKMVLKVIGGKFDGTVLEKPSFIKTKENINFLGKEMLTLGFDSDQWTLENGRPFSQEFPKAMRLLAGVRFSGQRKDSPGSKGRSFHNLYINKRLEDGKPAKFTAADIAAAVTRTPHRGSNGGGCVVAFNPSLAPRADRNGATPPGDPD